MHKAKFEKYKPPKPSNKLESHDRSKWMPSIHYKYTIQDIRTQLTPAEYYRARLVEFGPTIRALQRLEWKIQRLPAQTNSAALAFQALYRGFKGRKHFMAMRADLELRKDQRSAESLTKELMESQVALEVSETNSTTPNFSNYETAFLTLDSVSVPTLNMLILKAKMLYRMSKFSECEAASREAISKT